MKDFKSCFERKAMKDFELHVLFEYLALNANWQMLDSFFPVAMTTKVYLEFNFQYPLSNHRTRNNRIN